MEVYKRKEIEKPKHSKEEMEVLLIIVREMNAKFNKNHYYPKETIKPFRLVWTFDAEWYIACNNYWYDTDCKEVQEMRELFTKEIGEQIKFKWVFHIKVKGKEVFKIF